MSVLVSILTGIIGFVLAVVSGVIKDRRAFNLQRAKAIIDFNVKTLCDIQKPLQTMVHKAMDLYTLEITEKDSTSQKEDLKNCIREVEVLERIIMNGRIRKDIKGLRDSCNIMLTDTRNQGALFASLPKVYDDIAKRVGLEVCNSLLSVG